MKEFLQNYEEVVNFTFKVFPWILIGGWFLYSIIVLASREARERISNFYIVESIPNVFVTLGLFGTFTGIAYGLLYFDTAPDVIKDSITTLLDGLKLAMFTSITGILLSLIFSKIVQISVNSKSIKPPDSPELFELQQMNRNFIEFKNALQTSHYDALVDSLKDVLKNFNEVFMGFIDELVEQNFKELTETINQLSEWQKQHKDDVEELTNAYRKLVKKHTEFVDKTTEWVSKLDAISGQSSKLQHVIDEFNEAFNENGNLSKILRDVQASTNELKGASSNFSDITDRMSDTSNSIKLTGEKVTQWTDAVHTVSDNSQRIVEKVETLQSINVQHIDNLVEQFNTNLKGTFSTLDALVLEYIKSIENKINR